MCARACTYIHTYVRTYVRTYIQAGRQAGRQKGRQTDRQTDRHTYIHTYTHTHTHLYNMTSRKSELVSLTPLVESHYCNNFLIFSVPKFLDPPPLGGARIIHIRSGGFDTVNVIDGAIDGEPPPDGLSVQLEQDLHGIPNAPLMNLFPIKTSIYGGLSMGNQWENHGKSSSMGDFPASHVWWTKEDIPFGVGQQLEVNHINVRLWTACR